MIRARVHVTLKPSVLDPQGSAVEQSLRTLGYDEVREVRVGKFVELNVDTDDEREAEQRIGEMCERLLANTVIETYQVELGVA